MAGCAARRLLHPGHGKGGTMRSIFISVALIGTSYGLAMGGEQAPTYCRDIAPLLNNNCVTCHRPGQVAPFSLLNYSDARRHGKTIEAVVKKRIMPPWKPLPGYGEFVGERRLTDDQISLVQRWFSAGMPEGNRNDLPPPPTFTSGWQLGTPDIELTMSKPYQLPAEGNDQYRNFIVPFEVPDGKFIRALEFHPSSPRIVHHAVLTMAPAESVRKREENNPGGGFSQVAPVGKLLPACMCVWTPGWVPTPLPKDLALPWPNGTALVVQIHFHPSGKPESEQSKIGIYLTDQRPTRSTVGLQLLDQSIDIPAGEKAYHSRDFMFLPVDLDILGLFPHMHWLGKEAKVTAKLPDGEQRTLLWITDWDFRWQMFYQCAKPVRLPAGTEIIMDHVHDNSADNPNNPSLTPRRVRWGNETTDEMSILVIEAIPVNESDLPEINAAKEQHRRNRHRYQNSPPDQELN